MDAENASLRERLDDDDKYESELKAQVKDLERKVTDLEGKVSQCTKVTNWGLGSRSVTAQMPTNGV